MARTRQLLRKAVRSRLIRTVVARKQAAGLPILSGPLPARPKLQVPVGTLPPVPSYKPLKNAADLKKARAALKKPNALKKGQQVQGGDVAYNTNGDMTLSAWGRQVFHTIFAMCGNGIGEQAGLCTAATVAKSFARAYPDQKEHSEWVDQIDVTARELKDAKLIHRVEGDFGVAYAIPASAMPVAISLFGEGELRPNKLVAASQPEPEMKAKPASKKRKAPQLAKPARSKPAKSKKKPAKKR